MSVSDNTMRSRADRVEYLEVFTEITSEEFEEESHYHYDFSQFTPLACFVVLFEAIRKIVAKIEQKKLLRKASEQKEFLSVKARIRLKKLAVFWPIKVAQFLFVVYILIMTYLLITDDGLVDPSSSKNTENGVVLLNGSYRPIVARGTYQLVCLTISRASAFSLYPVMVMVFLTKCKATMSFFSKTPLSMYTTQDSHELHAYAGRYIAFDVWIHTLFHLLRWADQENISLLWTHRSGITGLIVVVVTPLITFPMMYWKKALSYEVRKCLHYLFYLFAVGMCFHVPPAAIPNGGFIAYVLGFCIGLYTLDALYVFIFMSEKIETTTFHVLPTGVQMTMDVSERFQNRGEQGGFAYVCLPWVDKNQWHAFSLFESPIEPSQRQVFMLNTGDWTKAVHEALERNTARPVWVQGPFASPYSNAEAYDNQILVASGIGITPALSVIRAHKESRRLNLIWVVRDPSMLEFFTEHMYLDHDGWNLIFYTGSKPLNPALEELNTNVRVHKGRPNLKVVIPNIVYGIESGVGKPEAYTPTEIESVKELLVQRIRKLDQMTRLSNREKLRELTSFASSQGFLFTELLNDIDDEDVPSGGRQSPVDGLLSNKTSSFDEDSSSYFVDGDSSSTSFADEFSSSSSSSYHNEDYSTTSSDWSSPSEDASSVISTHDAVTVVSSNITSRLSTTSMSKSRRAGSLLQRLRNYDDGKKYPQETPCWDDMGEEAVNYYDRGLRPPGYGYFDFSRTVSTRSLNAGRQIQRLKRGILEDSRSKASSTKVLTSAFDPATGGTISTKARKYVKELDSDAVLSTWGILYCGGSKPVEKDLKRIAVEYNIPLNLETFAW